MFDKDLTDSRMLTLQTLMSFKTQRCTDKECSQHCSPGLNIKICHAYHSTRDQRRFPFTKLEEHLDKYSYLTQRLRNDPQFSLVDLFTEVNLSLVMRGLGQLQVAYSQFYSGHEGHGSNCFNFVEFNYHPFNYKKQQCTDGSECRNIYCYRYHNEFERIEFNEVSKIFLEAEFRLTRQEMVSYNAIEASERFCSWSKEPVIVSDIEIQSNYVKNPETSDRGCLSTDMDNVHVSKSANHHKSLDTFDTKIDETDFLLKKRNAKEGYSANPCSKYKNVTKFIKSMGSRKKEIIKKGKYFCRPNYNNSSHFIYNKEIEAFESIHDEFKNFSKLDLRTCLNYICGFLNSYGGTLYFGINDDGIVKGMVLSRKDIDEFQIGLDISLRNFTPKVFPDQIAINYHEICYDDEAKLVIMNRYVIQIDILCKKHDEFYLTHEHQFFIKKHGSLNNLSLEEVIAFIKGRYGSLITHDHVLDRINPLVFERMSLMELIKVRRNLMDMVNFINTKL